MTARAASAAATAERILDAAAEVFYETAELPLEAVAARAGVSVQTVIRRFGSRDGLFGAGLEREMARVSGMRDAAVPGDLPGAVRNLVDHYEDTGEKVLRLLAVEDRSPAARHVTDQGRVLHRNWCARVFAAALEPLSGRERERRLAQLVAVTDVHTWQLLRRDAGLDRAEVELALRELLEPLIGDH